MHGQQNVKIQRSDLLYRARLDTEMPIYDTRDKKKHSKHILFTTHLMELRDVTSCRVKNLLKPKTQPTFHILLIWKFQ